MTTNTTLQDIGVTYEIVKPTLTELISFSEEWDKEDDALWEKY